MLKRSISKRNGRDHNIPIRSIGEVERPRSWAIYGRSGTGKTTLAATFPKPILLLDVRDQGTDSIADHQDIDVWDIHTWTDLETAYYYLKENPKQYKTVIIDTITQVQQICLEHIMTDKRKDSERVGDWGTMTRREWGDASGMMKDIVINFRDLPIEVVFIAQERTSTAEEDENPDNMLMPEVGPALMKSVANALNAAVSVIGNTFIRTHRYKKEVKGKKIEKEEAQYCLRVGPNPVYTTKLRKPKSVVAPSFIENAEYKDVVSIIKGE